MSDRQGPGAGVLLELDARIDALVAGEPAGGDGLVAVADRLAALPEAVWEEVAPLHQPPVRRHRRPARRAVRRSAAAAAAAAVATAAVLVGLTLSGGGRSAPPSATGWELAGYVDQPAWATAPAPGGVGGSVVVTCPTPSTCYAEQPNSASAAAVVEVTTDGGSTWTASDLPAGTEVTSAPSCPSAQRCVVAASGPSGPEALFTADGGTTWSGSPLPTGAGSVSDVACWSQTGCVAVGSGAGAAAAHRTTDGGSSWSATALPGAFVMAFGDGLSCVTGGCVAVGLVPDGTVTTGAIRYSADGGATWSEATLPAGVAEVTAVSCPDATHCLALGVGQSPSPGVPGSPEALVSADGGRTWAVAGPLGPDVLDLHSVSCPTPTACWVAGRTSASSGLVLSTSNGGASWTPVGLPMAGAPGSGLGSLDVQEVMSVSCPAVGHCVALGKRGVSASPDQTVVALRSPG